MTPPPDVNDPRPAAQTTDVPARDQAVHSRGGKLARSRAESETTGLVVSKQGVPLARVRRTPSVVAFLAAGFILGALAGLLLSVFGGEGGNYTPDSSAAYFFMLFGSLGALLGGVAYVIADGRAQRRR